MQELRERTVVKVIDGREFYRMELEDGTETHYLISKDGWTYYETHGRLRNCNLLKPNKKEYLKICVYHDRKPHDYKLHRALAHNFLIKHPDFYEVDHIDGVKSHNELYNLRWCDRSINMANMGSQKKGTGYEYISKIRNGNNSDVIRYRFRHYLSGNKDNNIFSSLVIDEVITFRDNWLKSKGRPMCLDIGATI